MKRALIAFLWLFPLSLLAAKIDLPRGGQVSLDTDEWDVLETKATPELRALLLVHKREKELRGFVLNGNINNQGVCNQKLGKNWTFCQKRHQTEKEVSEQIYGERTLEKDAVQTYVFSFNYAPRFESRYKPLIEKMRKDLEAP